MLSNLSFEITGTTFMIGVVLALFLIAAVILFMKSHFNKFAKAHEEGLHSDRPSGFQLDSRNKYPEADIFRWRVTFLNLGRMLALALTVMAFAWTKYDKTIDVSQYLETLEEEIEVEPPRTSEPPPPPPPPPPPVIQAVPDELIVEDQPDFVSQEITQETEITAPPAPKHEAPPPPPPPPPPPAKDEEEIFRVVEEMPRFPGCEDQPNADEKKKCADKKMLEFIYKNIKYPAIARENGVEGTAVITFVVEKDGTVTDVKVVRDIGAQCGQEAMRVVNMMNSEGIKWLPGKQRGRPVRVQFNLPVRFKLE